jgi:nitrous oxide reductase accessory protein NosL
MCNRRHFLGHVVPWCAAGFVLTPLAGLLSACSHSKLPEGMVEIKWDRDACARCSMIISDRRFAVQLRGGPKNESFKFDDIGCAVIWLKSKGWASDSTLHIWVTDSADPTGSRWLDARKAQYVGKTSPMAYNFAAVSLPQAGSLEFEDVRQHVLAKG